MPNFNDMQGALTIFYDQTDHEHSIPVYLKRAFPVQQYLYQKAETLPDGKGLVKNIQEVLESYEVILPKKKRFVFCYYLNLDQLTEEWVDRYFERAETLNQAQPTPDMMDQHHVICLRHRVSDLEGTENKEKKEAIIRQLLRIYQEKPGISKQIFFLRATAFESFDDQENGLVYALFLLSRANNTHVVTSFNSSRAFLRMLEYTDYYEERTSRCDEEIEEINQWIKEPADPELVKITEQSKLILSKTVKDFTDRSKNFRRLVSLYPMSAEDFEGNALFGFRPVEKNDRVIEECRRKYMEDKKAGVRKEVNLEELEALLKEEYHFPDYENLEKKLTDGTLQESLSSGDLPPNPDLKKYAEELAEEVKAEMLKLIEDYTAKRDEKREQKEQELRQLRKESNSTTYRSLEECFAQIDEDTRQEPINGVFGDLSYRFTFINNTCLDRLTGGSEIKGVPTQSTFVYSGIDPCEIVMLKEYLIVKLTDADAEQKLAYIIN